MQAIIDQINQAAGKFLISQGLKAVYEHAEDPDVSDDSVVFVDGQGLRSVVSLQVSSLRPSLNGASVSVMLMKSRALPLEGWRFVEVDSFLQMSPPNNAAGLIAQAVEALGTYAGQFDVTEVLRDGILTHPHSVEAFETIGEFAQEADAVLSIRPYVKEDGEGFEIVADDGRAARVDVLPGKYEVTAAGERSSVAFQSRGRTELLKGILEASFPSMGMRP